MEELISFQNNLLEQVSNTWHRYLYPGLQTKERLLGLKGLRGVGKTTLLLQYLAFGYPEKQRGLYVTADHPYFYNNSLYELAAAWYRYNGNLLLIDEVHKYLNWSRELKLIYDGHPKMKIIFTSSSALDLYRGESDLSRRLAVQNLYGLSFREFLSFKHQVNLGKLSLKEILKNPRKATAEITSVIKPLPFFKEYLRSGYFPFIRDIEENNLVPRLIQIINTVLESDLAFIQGYNASHIAAIKKLLGVIAVSAPFEPNISKIAERLHLSRANVYQYLTHLRDAQILRLVNKVNKGLSHLQKPDKIYFENSSFAYALQGNPETGTVRETFFMNQLYNAGHEVHLAEKGDFLVDRQWTFEVGGRNKNSSQIKTTTDSWLALDDEDTAVGNRIPLWLFGLLY